MRDPKPKGLWEQLRQALLNRERSDREQADPSLAFHLFFIVPILTTLLMGLRRMA